MAGLGRQGTARQGAAGLDLAGMDGQCEMTFTTNPPLEALMYRFTDYRPQVAHDPQDGPEPSLFEIIERYYTDLELDDPQKATADYINAWLTLERVNRASQAEEAAKVEQHQELLGILRQLNSLAETAPWNIWGDEGVLAICRDRLRKLVNPES